MLNRYLAHHIDENDNGEFSETFEEHWKVNFFRINKYDIGKSFFQKIDYKGLVDAGVKIPKMHQIKEKSNFYKR